MVLSSEAVEFLLQLLELPEPLLSAGGVELRPTPTAQLIAAGLLEPHDHEEVATSMADHDDVPVSLIWSEQSGSLAYFSPAVGLVAVPAEQLLRRCVAIGPTFAALTAGMGLRAGSAHWN